MCKQNIELKVSIPVKVNVYWNWKNMMIIRFLIWNSMTFIVASGLGSEIGVSFIIIRVNSPLLISCCIVISLYLAIGQQHWFLLEKIPFPNSILITSRPRRRKRKFEGKTFIKRCVWKLMKKHHSKLNIQIDWNFILIYCKHCYYLRITHFLIIARVHTY